MDVIQALQSCNECAENLESNAKDLDLQSLEQVCSTSAGRAGSCRYRDPPEIKQLIIDRRALRGAEARKSAATVLQARKRAKATWLQDLLSQAAAGNFHAASYFRRRGRVNTQMNGYILRAGGFQRALVDLQTFYRRKFTPPNRQIPDAAMALYLAKTGAVPACDLFTEQEVSAVVYAMKTGKSAGSELRVHFVEMLNGILVGDTPLPQAWMMSHVVFLPKTSSPACPKDLRPIVLSSTVSKVFTRLLLQRLRPKFPLMSSGQIIGEEGGQTLDAALAVQHSIRLSEERKQALVVGQLDIAEAFDTVAHEAVAGYLAAAGPAREGHLLLRLVTEASVTLQLAGVSWVQPLRRGIVQGAPYSAELFARILDYHARGVHAEWQLHEETWLQTCVCSLLLLMYADDIVLLATSCAQMARMVAGLSAVLDAIGLKLSFAKCKFLKGCHVADDSLLIGGSPVAFVQRFDFLGILMGFSVSCVDVLIHRLGKAAKNFHGFYRILCRGSAPVQKRLQLLDTFVTSKWRWMAPAIRPVSTVRKVLDTLHLTYVTSIVCLQYDPFMSCINNWTTRRRAARMAAHLVRHVAWSVTQAKQFFSYWGHAARLPLLGRRPVRIAMEVFGVDWTRRHEGIVLRQVGYWRNSVRFLQLAWEQIRHVREPFSWIEFSVHRHEWRQVWARWLTSKGWLCAGMTADPCQENLMGRQLLQLGRRFHLLPMRHFPVEEVYDSVLRVVPQDCEDNSLAQFPVATDGSAKAEVGAYAAVLLAPYSEIETAIVGRGRMSVSATNITAEMQASIQGLRMALEVHQVTGIESFVLLTDSMYVVQLLEESIITTRHAGPAAELLSLWHRLLLLTDISARWVKGHARCTLNNIADAHARHMLSASSCKVEYVRALTHERL